MIVGHPGVRPNLELVRQSDAKPVQLDAVITHLIARLDLDRLSMEEAMKLRILAQTVRDLATAKRIASELPEAKRPQSRGLSEVAAAYVRRQLFGGDDWIAGERAPDSRLPAPDEPRSLANFLDSRNDGDAADANNRIADEANPEDAVAETAAVSNILERCSREGVLLSLTREARLGVGGNPPPSPELMAAIEAHAPVIVAELIKAKNRPERDFET